ncbi:hypothetical protein LDENG_00099550, partial [Lucifuga dentata]
GLLTILILLDLSTTFDTISHSLLLQRLASIGVDSSALLWFSSYLSNHKQFVQLGNLHSEPAPLTQGVPQGSVLWLLLFIIYLFPLGHILHHYGIQFHCYADDTQLYIYPPRPTPPFYLLPSPAVSKTLNSGCPIISLNSTAIKARFSSLARNPHSPKHPHSPFLLMTAWFTSPLR